MSRALLLVLLVGCGGAQSNTALNATRATYNAAEAAYLAVEAETRPHVAELAQRAYDDSTNQAEYDAAIASSLELGHALEDVRTALAGIRDAIRAWEAAGTADVITTAACSLSSLSQALAILKAHGVNLPAELKGVLPIAERICQ